MGKTAYKLEGGRIVTVEEAIEVTPHGELRSTTARILEGPMVATHHFTRTNNEIATRVMMEIEFTTRDSGGDADVRDRLSHIAEIIGSMEGQEVHVGGVFARFREAGRIVVDGLSERDGAETFMSFESRAAMAERIQEMAFEEWMAEVMLAVAPYLKNYNDKMPGDVIADALRALADKYEAL